MVGLKAGVDLLLWSLSPSLEALEEKTAAAMRAGMGSWMSVRHSFLGLISASQYVKRPTSQEQSLFSGERTRYLIVYPFTKSADWYLVPQDERQRVMNEHMKVGHRYQQVRQLLAYSFGLERIREQLANLLVAVSDLHVLVHHPLPLILRNEVPIGALGEGIDDEIASPLAAEQRLLLRGGPLDVLRGGDQPEEAVPDAHPRPHARTHCCGRLLFKRLQ